MAVEDIATKIGTEVRILPEPEVVNAKRQLAAVRPNEWRIEGVQGKHVELKNSISGHVILLSTSYIREFHGNQMDIRFKIVLKGKRTVF
jgi:hypothetical protein